jgi:hypothetical protein
LYHMFDWTVWILQAAYLKQWCTLENWTLFCEGCSKCHIFYDFLLVLF